MYNRIKDLREDNDYSQDYVSKLLGCSRSNYAMYESGSVKIKIEQLAKLADIYSISTDYLLGITSVKPSEINPNPYVKKKFIRNVKILRTERKLQQLFLATQVLNCTQASYSQYENGKRMISVDTVIALAKYYKVSIDFLIGRSDNPNPY